MAEGSSLEELEYKNLQGVVAAVEALIAFATPDARGIYEGALSNARARLEFLEKTIAEHKAEGERRQQEQTAAAALAAKETKLSANERETYRGFLEESYFTKKDFGQLDKFYAHSYDLLSEGGKDQMSKRFWEGVKHGEYQFGNAPSIMQRKEAERAKNRLGLSELDTTRLGGMSNDEQRALADAYHSEDRAKAKQILARNSVTRSGDNPDAANGGRPSVKVEHASPITDIDLSAVDLKNVQLADATTISSASIPDASGSRINAR